MADFFADLVARDRRTPEADGTSQARIQELVDRFQRHQAESNIEASFSNKWPQARLVTLVNTCKQTRNHRGLDCDGGFLCTCKRHVGCTCCTLRRTVHLLLGCI